MPSNRRIIITTLTAVLFLLSAPIAVAGNKPYVHGELLVKYRTTANPYSRSVLQHAARVQHSQTIGNSQIHRVILGPDTTVEEAMVAYADDPSVEFAEPNYILTAQAVPDDQGYAEQWGLHNTGQVVSNYMGSEGADIDAQMAWDISTGDTSVVVAVIDTGCDLNHPDIVDNLWTNPGEIADNGIDDDANGFIDDVRGWDFMDNDNTPQDTAGHGTHVAGIIAATSDNNRGIAGTAWNVRLLPLRFMNAFSQGSTSDAISAINYAVASGARIINCSWGGSGYSASLDDTMASANALFICAAGNNGVDLDNTAFYPAGFSANNVLSVAASDQNDNLCWFSNYSATSVDVAAPGIRIYSLDRGRQALWSESFDGGELADMDGWTTGGSGNTWGVAGPPGMPAMTTLALNPQDNYENNADTWVRAPVRNLSNATGTVLTFLLIGRSEEGVDRLTVEISTDGETWTARPMKVGSSIESNGISGTVSYLSPVTADLGPWDHAPQLYFRLRFRSDENTTFDGFYIDDISLEAAAEQDTYQYMQGTSMAAGYVSGIAALIQSENNTLTPFEIHELIVDSVESVDDLANTTATGGRVNAYRTLSLQTGSALPENSLERSNSGGGGGGGGCFIGSLPD